MKVINPADSALEIQFRGVVYRVEAGGVLENVPADAANYWKTMIHNFIVIADDSVAAPEPAEAPVVEEAEEVVEVAPVVEEEAVVEEAPAAPKKSKK